MSRRLARFRIHDGSNLVRGGSVVVDRALGLVTIRQFRRKKAVTVPLWWVADLVLWRAAKLELQEKAKAHRKRKVQK